MKRSLGAAVGLIAALGCGPETPSQPCPSGPDFVVSVSAATGALPRSTAVEVTFGGGSVETYSPATVTQPRVVFCKTVHSAVGGEGGAGGAGTDGGAGADAAGASSSPSGHLPIRRIVCDLWTNGPATITVKAFDWKETRDLKRDDELCQTDESIVLGAPPTKP